MLRWGLLHLAGGFAFTLAAGTLPLTSTGLADESNCCCADGAATFSEATPIRLAQQTVEETVEDPQPVEDLEIEAESEPLVDLDALSELQALLEEPVLVREPVATTVSRVEERVVETPGTVYVYTREVIQHRGYRSLGELLRTVPGFTVFHRDLQFVVGVRGFNANDNDKVSLLINGQRVLGMHEQEFLNGPINLDNVERVEVVVGPSSLFQQADTLAATINLITKDTEGTEVISAVGTSLEYSTTVMTGRRWAEDAFLNFSFTTEEKRGFDAWDPLFRQNLAGRGLTGKLDQPNFFGVLKGQYGDFSAQAIAYRSTWPELLINNGALTNDGEFTEEFYSLFLKYEREFDSAWTGVADFDVALKEQTRLNQNGPPADAAEVSFKQWVYQGELGLRFQGWDRHLVQTGVQASIDRNFDTFFTYNEDPPFPGGIHIPRTTMVDRGTYALGFYLDDQMSVTDRLKLIAGFRLDKNTRLPDNTWYPGARAAIVYQTTEKWFTKLTYNRSVRMPSPAQSLNTVWGTNNPDLPIKPYWANLSPTVNAPEILSTIELHNVWYLDPARLGIIFYHEELSDFITWFQPWSNGGNFRGNGIELTLDAEVNPCTTIWANAAWNDTYLNLFNDTLFGVGGPGVEQHHAYISPDGRIIGSAEWTANLGFDYEIAPRLTFSPAIRYFTEQAAVDQVSPTRNEFVTIRNRVYLDAGLTWDHLWCRDMDLRLSARNLLDNRRPVGAQLAGDLYRPRGIEVVLTLDMRL
jgi:outer membrane receptor protein involved in Fe transport